MKTYKPISKRTEYFEETLDPSIEEFLKRYAEPTDHALPYTVEIGSFETNDFWFEHFATLTEAEGCEAFWDGKDGLEAWICGRPEPSSEEKFAREFEYEQREREKLRAEAEAKLAKNDFVLCWAWYWHYIGDENVVFAVAHTVDEVLKAYDKCQTLEDYRWDGLE